MIFTSLVNLHDDPNTEEWLSIVSEPMTVVELCVFDAFIVFAADLQDYCKQSAIVTRPHLKEQHCKQRAAYGQTTANEWNFTYE